MKKDRGGGREKEQTTKKQNRNILTQKDVPSGGEVL